VVNSPNRYLCIHGHFYQPPRENPWLEAVEVEKSAAPYHDWNERITDECYAVNLAARILDGSNQIVSIVNNYSRFSFDFGPTLLAWLEAKHPEVYTAVIDSDRENASEYSGHGSALAQAYNHIIMPLANRRDKETQVIWGISDFRHRFGREPEGMWLPETAVDLETLDIMANNGIKFTVLAPHQARRIKTLDGTWRDTGDSFDTNQPYVCRLPSGRSIALFFYNRELSRGVAFGNLLENGDQLTDSILGAYSENNNPSLVMLATDGETYGHHRRFGDMAVAYAFDKITSGVKITNMAEYLELHPPTTEVEIVENSAWSCDHGVERWRSGCCCATGFHRDWTQAWRVPLRQAMDLLRDRLNPLFEKEAKLLLVDPWQTRNAYQSVMADRSQDNVDTFLKHWASKPLSETEKIRVLKLMELQRYLMSIYTSCGWFFDDIGGLESILVMKQAGRVLQLAEQLFRETPEKEFLNILETAHSNERSLGSGWDIFEREVRPLIVGLENAAANFAIDSLFRESPMEPKYTFLTVINDLKKFGTESLLITSGDIQISSTITKETQRFIFGAMLWGEHNLAGGFEIFQGSQDYASLLSDLKSISDQADCDGCLKYMENRFPGTGLNLHDLFADERAVIVEDIIASILVDAETAHRRIYSRHRDTMKFLVSIGQPTPPQLTTSAAFVLNTDLRNGLISDTPNLETMEELLAEMKMWGIQPDKDSISYYLSGQLENILLGLIDNPDDKLALSEAAGLLHLFREIIMFSNLWRIQNLYFVLYQNIYIQRRGQINYDSWSESFRALGRLLSIKVD
jgi:hypothetical protein